MNLKSELHLSKFQNLLSKVNKDLEEDIENLKKEIEEKRRHLAEIEFINKYLNNVSDNIPLKNIREWGHNFEEQTYSQDFLFPYEKKMTEHLYRFQNVYSTEKVLKYMIGLSDEFKERTVNQFPVIKIWHDIYSSSKCGSFNIEYNKYQILLNTRPDEFYFTFHLFLNNNESENSKLITSLHMLKVFNKFNGKTLDKLEEIVNEIYVENYGELHKDFKLGIMIMGYFYFFNYLEESIPEELTPLKKYFNIHF